MLKCTKREILIPHFMKSAFTKIQVFWEVKPYRVVNNYLHFQTFLGLLDPDDEGTIALQNGS
jgi:hypothetical protein